MEDFLNEYGYLALLIGSFLEGEISILIASSLVHNGIFEIPWTIMAGFGGSFISDWIYYFMGRLNGKYFIEKRPVLKTIAAPVQKFVNSHKVQILLTYRFLYGFRVIIPVVLGMSGVKPLQYLAFSVAAGLLWATSVHAIGYFIGYFLNVSAAIFEENLILIAAGFAVFGLLSGWAIKKIISRKLHIDNK